MTTDYVLGLEVVLAEGSAVRLGGPLVKDVAGLPLTKLFVGSEGSLGIVTEVTLRLIPAQQRARIAVAFFRSLDDATNAVIGITARIRPSLLEFMDRATVNAVEDVTRMGLDREAEALLLIGTDAAGDAADRELAIIEEVLRENSVGEHFVAADAEDADAFLAVRRMALPATERLGTVLVEDVGVPLPQLGAMIRGLEPIARRHGVLVTVVAHAGDGNTHPCVVYDAADPAQVVAAGLAFADIMDLAIALGGTITGEHGIGTMKNAWLPKQLGDPAYQLNLRIKRALDPDGILNPGIGL